MFCDMNSYIFRILVYDILQKWFPKNIILIFAFSESQFYGCSHGSGIFVGNSNLTSFRFWSSVPQRRRGKQATIGKAGGRNSWSERRRGENRIVGSFVCSFSSLRSRRSAGSAQLVIVMFACGVASLPVPRGNGMQRSEKASSPNVWKGG